MSRSLTTASFLSLLTACAIEPASSDSDGGSTGGGATTDEGPPTTGEGGSSGATGTSGDATTSGTSGTSTTSGTPGTTTSGDATTTSGGTTGDLGPEPQLPTPTMPCPEIVDGTVTFQPAGIAPRAVRIWVDPAAAAGADGPLIFYWHGTGSQPSEALYGLGDLGVQEVLDAGGMIVAPTHDPMAGAFPWFLVLGQQLDDLLLADEVLACAQEQFGVDAARIATAGFSAGGLQTAQMSIRRSNYISAAVPYSGGLIFGSMPPFEQPDNKFSAMIFHGGANDVVVVGFEQASKDYSAYLATGDRFSFLCDHGQGHTIPDAQDSVMQFLHDHPYGTTPSPYAQGLPGDFPTYCAIP